MKRRHLRSPKNEFDEGICVKTADLKLYAWNETKQYSMLSKRGIGMVFGIGSSLETGQGYQKQLQSPHESNFPLRCDCDISVAANSCGGCNDPSSSCRGCNEPSSSGRSVLLSSSYAGTTEVPSISRGARSTGPNTAAARLRRR